MALLLAATTALPPGPVDFSAVQMRYEAKEHRVFLDGDVKLLRGDLTVTGDHVVMYSAPPKAPRRGKAETSVGGQNVERFTADGNVHVARGARTAEGAHGEVNMLEQVMVLTGTPEAPPVVRERNDVLAGERILLHLDSDDMDVQKPRIVLHRSLPEEKLEDEKHKDAPIRVEAAHMLALQEQQVAHFTGNVVVHRDEMVVKSPRMDALYDKDGQLTRLEMRSGVDLREGDRRATGQNGDYDAKTHLVVLTGDPHLYDRGDALTGDRIEMALDTKEVHVEHVRGRVRPEQHKNEMEAHR